MEQTAEEEGAENERLRTSSPSVVSLGTRIRRQRNMGEQEMKWKVEKMCGNCPFAKEGEGAHLRESLGEQWPRIIKSLEYSCFPCHKTTEATGNSTNLICAGALQYQEERGLSPQYKQVMERLSAMEKRKEQKDGTRSATHI